MKRSTLTLSILTALLVSACGGSSSNDEQTKDPTPPKVTPTHPTTPSTGKTPTTGNKGDAGSSAGSSAASSSSSDPTPPISSGSAPSGGKPIVIESNGTKEKETPNEDKNPQEETLKKLEAKIATLKENDQRLEAEKRAAANRLHVLAVGDGKNESETKVMWGRQDELRKALANNNKLGLSTQTDKNDAGLETLTFLVNSKKGTDDYNQLKEALDKYKEAFDRWQEKKDQIPKLEENLKTTTKKYIDNKKELADLEAQVGLANADGVKIEKEFYDLKKSQAELQYKFDLQEAQFEQSKFTAAQAENDKGALNEKLKDLKLAIKQEGISEKKKASLEDEIKSLETQIESKTTLIKTSTQQKNDAQSEMNSIGSLLKTAKEKVAGLVEALKYRGVAAEGKLSNESFAEISKVEHNTSGDKWTLTFADGSSQEIDVNASSNVKTIKKGEAVYGKFITSTGTNGLVAHQKGDDKASGTNYSIYGYIGSKFYSVGEVTKPEEIKKLSIASYKGKALLQAKDKSGLIADFKANVNFSKGEVEGNFNGFASYDRNGTDDTTVIAKGIPESLKDVDKVDFHAQIKGNKFVTEKAPENEASVYGYFYGDKAQEAGGLVEYKDVFHGSFGGAQ